MTMKHQSKHDIRPQKMTARPEGFEARQYLRRADRYTEVERCQHIGQADRRIFGQSYGANCSSVDGLAAFLNYEKAGCRCTVGPTHSTTKTFGTTEQDSPKVSMPSARMPSRRSNGRQALAKHISMGHTFISWKRLTSSRCKPQSLYWAQRSPPCH
jgi:hypothetical protein